MLLYFPELFRLNYDRTIFPNDKNASRSYWKTKIKQAYVGSFEIPRNEGETKKKTR